MGIDDRDYMRNCHVPGIPVRGKPSIVSRIKFALWRLWNLILLKKQNKT